MTYIYLVSPGNDRFAIAAVLRSTLKMSLGDANSVLKSMPARLEVDDAKAGLVFNLLAQSGAYVTYDADEAGMKPAPAKPAAKPEPKAEPKVAPKVTTAPKTAPKVTTAPKATPKSAPVTDPGTPAPVTNPGTPAPKPAKSSAPAVPCVIIVDSGNSKLQVVKVVHDCMNWGLKESKEYVDNAPALTTFEDYDRARYFAASLSAAGSMAYVLKDTPDKFRHSRPFAALNPYELKTLEPQAEKYGKQAPQDPIPTVGASIPTVGAAPKAKSALKAISVTDPGPKRMQLIPLFKKEFKMNYGSAASIAEGGGNLPAFADDAQARRVCDALDALSCKYKSI